MAKQEKKTAARSATGTMRAAGGTARVTDGTVCAKDGTREYRPHSGQARQHTAMDGAPAGLGALNASVYEGLRNRDFYPGLAYSGEVARQGKDGRPRYEDSVVQHQVEMRQEMPYG